MEAHIEASEEELMATLKRLYDTWPADGWPGAAAIIAPHADKAYAIEAEFVRRHTEAGKHGPIHPYYDNLCCCRKHSFPRQ